jgi:hypothetical protein
MPLRALNQIARQRLAGKFNEMSVQDRADFGGSALSVVCVLAGVVMAASASAEELLLWNRFGSQEEVARGTFHHGQHWGPGFTQTSTPANSAAPGGQLAFAPGTQQHFAVAWDVDGIDGTDDTLRIYVNGDLEGANTQMWDDAFPLQRYLYIGTTPCRGPWDHNYNAVKGVTDNIKIWDYAAIDAIDHRFDEDYVPEPSALSMLALAGLAIMRRR